MREVEGGEGLVRTPTRQNPHSSNILESYFRDSFEVPHLPVGMEGIRWGHPKPHDGVEESLALPRVKSKHLAK